MEGLLRSTLYPPKIMKDGKFLFQTRDFLL